LTLKEYNLKMAYAEYDKNAVSKGLYIEGEESDVLFFMLKYS
jgi:hypothetical protein